ncbi:MAG: short-chain dehydrogenase [Rhodospirillales bacterium 20-64-7]|nr:MAG: short-chain dehydrogenase [Rhodospirillales bacterium 20-64-7]
MGPANALLQNRWDAAEAVLLSPEDLLVYRSNLLGSDVRITNYGGGNTSSKLTMRDPLDGREVEVLWVKGSGGDLGSIRRDGFATLVMDRLRTLRAGYQGAAMEDAMVALYPHCTFALNPRATSIDTPLHGLIHYPHVDHVHPDAVIAIATAVNGEALTREVWGGEIGWLPWRRPGFELGVWLEDFVTQNPQAKGVVLGQHGLFTWGATQRDCYEATIGVINRAIAWLGERSTGRAPFGALIIPPATPERRREIVAAILPALRGMIAQHGPKIAHFDDQPAVLDFLGGARLTELAGLGTSCPDHFLRTKIRPLVLDFDPAHETPEALLARAPAAIAAYRADYAAYYARCRHADSPAMRDASPVIVLIPGIGMASFAGDATTARIAAEFYVNAINVIRGAESVSTYQGLAEQEAFDIEYWLLEEAKLQRMPKPRPLAGRVALITGGAGGIGMASARRLAAEGAAIVICDIDHDALAAAEGELQALAGRDRVAALHADVTDEASVVALLAQTALRFGGIDICVCNAGIASAAPFEETSLALWQRNMDILSTGYFLVAREAFRAMVAAQSGGSIIFVGSKNALVASANASAYCAAKASELHLARCLALEGAPHGIRANVVNPDAVLRGSRIWKGEWGDQRAAAYGTGRDGLEEIYRERSLLKRSVYPEDIAEAIAFFALDISSKSTGNILNVDAGHAPAFTR